MSRFLSSVDPSFTLTVGEGGGAAAFTLSDFMTVGRRGEGGGEATDAPLIS